MYGKRGVGRGAISFGIVANKIWALVRDYAALSKMGGKATGRLGRDKDEGKLGRG